MADKIEFTVITLIFPKPLDGRQETVLRVNLGDMGDDAAKKCETIISKLEANPAFQTEPAKTIALAYATRLRYMSMVMRDRIKLEQKNETTWQLTIPSGQLDMLKVSLPFKQQFRLKLITPDQVIRGLRQHILPLKTRTGYEGIGLIPEIKTEVLTVGT